MIKILNHFKLVLISSSFLLLFVHFAYLPYVIVLYIFLTLISLNYKKVNFKYYKNAWVIILLFIINSFSLIYSHNFNEGFTTIQTQLSLVIFPVLMLYDLDFFYNNKKRLINLFIASSLVSILIFGIIFMDSGGMIKIIEAFGKLNLFRLVRYFNLSADQHPSYISMAYLFSIILLLKFINKRKRIYVYILKIMGVFIILFFVFILNSRASLLTVVFISVYFVLKKLVKFSFWVKICGVFVVLGFFLILFSNSRFSQNIDNYRKASSIEQIDLRFSLWRNAFIVWKEKPMFGHGIGDAKDCLLEIHKERRVTKAVENNLNCHNQFLETATQTGMVGLIILLLVFAIPLYQSIKKKQELLFLFLMICFINFMFESMLQRLAGVVFFSFWYSFLWFVYYRDDEKKELN